MEATEPPAPAPPPAEPPPPPAAPPSGEYPARVDATLAPEYNRVLPFVKWLLALPHYIVLAFLGIAAVVVIVISFFAVLITGRFPRGMWDFLVGVNRWGTRVGGYVLMLTDQYPPFSLEDDPAYPVRVEADYPEAVDRWRPLVQWLLVIPYAIASRILMYLAFAVAVIAAFVILFTKNLPEGMFKLILNPIRWQLRANFYAVWMLTKYPPFEWE